MIETDFVESVYRSNGFASREQAEAVTRSTLRNLGRNVTVGEARDIAARLPPDLSEELVDVERTQAQPVEYDSFLERVAEDTGFPGESIEASVQRVMVVLEEQVGETELANAEAQLPPSYGPIFDIEPAAIGRPFVDFVTDRTGFDPGVDAEAMVRAVLETLGARLSRGEAEDLATYLEGEAVQWLTDEASTDAEDISAAEFVDRVATRTDVSEATARASIQVVGNALADIVPPDEIEKALEQLPAGFDSLLAFEE
jgi:uncharacterized protein (DUF2267 family)